MKRVIEEVKAGKRVNTEELFELVNDSSYTLLQAVSPDEIEVCCLAVNQYEQRNGIYAFFQTGSDGDENSYTIKADEIKTVRAEYHHNEDLLHIKCDLHNGAKLMVIVFNAETGLTEKTSGSYRKIDIEDFKERLEGILNEQDRYSYSLVKVSDVHGFDLILTPHRVYMDTLDEESWKLHISDNSNKLEVPMGYENASRFYVKDSELMQEFIVRPYGQPFMKIQMIVMKHE